jgi:hypothetical protein
MRKVDELLRNWVFENRDRADNFIQRTFEVWKNYDTLPNDPILGSKMYDYLTVVKGYKVEDAQKKKAYAAAKKYEKDAALLIPVAKTQCLVFIFEQMKDLRSKK